jgi:hypothetical protein
MRGVTGSDGDAPQQSTPGFGERGRMRRRARFLRKARELAYRDLGGLVFDLHRFSARNDEVVSAKLATLAQMDAELRAIERALGHGDTVTVLREVGIAACPRCAAIHGRDDRFCPGCGLAFDANAERPLSTAPVNAPAPAPVSAPSSVPATVRSSGLAPLATAAASPPTPSVAKPAASEANPTPSETKPAAPPTRTPPPLVPTAPPVAAPSSSGSSQPAKEGQVEPSGNQTEGKPADEQEPTQILRPPVRGA